MDKIRDMWYARSYDFIVALGLLSKLESHISMPMARYVMSSWVCIPVKNIIVGERPYGTDILPYAASAMSYDREKNPQGTPSTITLATDIANKHDISADIVEEWFRDSWKYLRHGVFLVNVCCYTRFMEKSLYERTCTEEFLRDMTYVSLLVDKNNIHMFPMGNPAQHTVGKVRSSVSDMREKIRVHSCPNPASLSHRKSDLRSPEITLSKPGVSRLLFQLVESTIASRTKLTEHDYFTMSLGPSSELSTVFSKSNALADEFANVEQYFKSGAAANSDPSGEEVFKNAKKAVSEFAMVINNAKIGMLFATVNEPPSIAKGAFKARDRGYTPKKFEVGVSSNVSSKSTPVRKAVTENVGFADDEDEQLTTSAVATPPSTIAHTPKSTSIVTPRTPANRKTTSIVPGSGTSVRSVSIGFVDDESGEETTAVPVTRQKSLSVSSDDILTTSEINSITYVSDFIESTSEYNFPASINEDVHECIRTKRASSERARGLVESIRAAVANGGRDAFEALGYKDDITDMASPIVQWLISQAE